MSAPPTENILDRLIAEAQADDYALAGDAQRGAAPGRIIGSALVLALIGLLFAMAVIQTAQVAPGAAQRREELLTRIDEQTQRVDAAQQQAAELRASVSQLQRLATGGLSEDFAQQLRSLEIATGFVALTGPGAVLTLEDARPPLPKGVDPQEARVLDVDVQSAVNGLWEAGAQAVAVNDIRLTSTTAIRTAGEAILVDYRPLVPPYRITALGPPDLPKRFGRTAAAGELDSLRKKYGIESDLVAADGASVPASTANLPILAEPDRSGGADSTSSKRQG